MSRRRAEPRKPSAPLRTGDAVRVHVPKEERTDPAHKRWAQLWRYAGRAVNVVGQYVLIEYQRGSKLFRTRTYTRFMRPPGKG